MRLFARRPDYSLTEREVAERIRPYGQGIQAQPTQPIEPLYVPTPLALEQLLNDRQTETLRLLRQQHDEVTPTRILESCGTCWVEACDYDDGGRHLTHHVITKEGIAL